MGDLDAARESVAVLAPDQRVLHRGRRATFLHMSRGAAIIRYWGDSHAVSVSPEALSIPLAGTVAKRPLTASDEPMLREMAYRQRLRFRGRKVSPRAISEKSDARSRGGWESRNSHPAGVGLFEDRRLQNPARRPP
jgi:hypothetical protein